MPLGYKQKHIVPIPKSKLTRRVLGILFIIGGILGFLPIVGFWMLPLGIVFLSVDSKWMRRLRRKSEKHIVKWWRERQSKKNRD